MVEVACTGNAIHHCTGSCRLSSWKCYSLDDTEYLQREKVWMTCYLVSFHSPRKQRNDFFFTCFPLLIHFCSLKFLLSWLGTIDVMVLQSGVMQADCLRICRSLSTVLQGPAEWRHWRAHLPAHCLTWLQSQLQLLRKELHWAVRAFCPGLAEPRPDPLCCALPADPGILCVPRATTQLWTQCHYFDNNECSYYSFPLWLCFTFFVLFDGTESRCAWKIP